MGLLILLPIYVSTAYVMPLLDSLRDFYANADVIAEKAALGETRNHFYDVHRVSLNNHRY